VAILRTFGQMTRVLTSCLAIGALAFPRASYGQSAADPSEDVDAVPSAILNAPTPIDTSPKPAALNITNTTVLGIDREWLPEQGDLPIPVHGPGDPENLMRLYVDDRAQWHMSPNLYLFSSLKGSILGGYSYDDQSIGNISGRFDVREFYLRWGAAPQFFLDVGRINVNNGVGVGSNPTDFFKAHAVVDTLTHDYESWTDDRLGSVMIRAEKVFESGAISFIYSPKLAQPAPISEFSSGVGLQLDRTNYANRFLIKLSHDFGGDASPELLFYKEANSWQFGFNLTKNINAASTFFLEWAGGNADALADQAMQYGRETGAFAPDTPTVVGSGSTFFRNQVSTGITYTWLSKVSVILSYNYNQAGLSRAEWNKWFQAGQPGSPDSSLVSREFWYMRTFGSQVREMENRQSLFFRIEKDDLFLHNLNFAVFVVADMETNSYLVNSGFDYRVSDRWRVQLSAEKKFGKKWSEFGSDTTSGDLLLSIKCYL
jgi:hypothetical protein